MRIQCDDIEVNTCFEGWPGFLTIKNVRRDDDSLGALGEEQFRALHYMLGRAIAQFEARRK